MKVIKFKRGQIWWHENLQSYDGSIQGKTRPVIIVSNNIANENSKNLTIVPCSTQIKRTDLPVHVIFKIDNIDNIALCESIQTINSGKLKDYIGQCDNELMTEISNKIKIALGLENLKSKTETITYKQNISEYKNNSEIKLNLIKSEKVSKVGRPKKLSIEEKQNFLKDLEISGSEYVMKKYNIKDKSTVSKMKYSYKKAIEKEQINDSKI